MFAQGITDTVCRRAELPVASRLSPGTPTLRTFPIWGCILDDVWVIRTSEGQDDNREASSWLGRVDSQWASVGVASHPKKAVNDGLNLEVQGAYVDSRAHTMSLSPEKKLDLFAACMWINTLYSRHRQSMARLVGKLGFAHCFRPPLRASFGVAFQFLENEREAKRTRGVVPEAVWWEILEAGLLSPLAYLDFSAGWTPTVHTTDAAGTGGHGLAYAYIPKETVQDWAQSCSWRGAAPTSRWKRGPTRVPWSWRTYHCEVISGTRWRNLVGARTLDSKSSTHKTGVYYGG